MTCNKLVIIEIERLGNELSRNVARSDEHRIIISTVILNAKQDVVFKDDIYPNHILAAFSIRYSALKIRESDVYKDADFLCEIESWSNSIINNANKKTVVLNLNTYYTRLGIKESAELHEIKMAYRMKVLKCHPDLNENSEESKLEFIRVQKAYVVLTDNDRKKAYDLSLKNYREKSSEQQSKSEFISQQTQTGSQKNNQPNVVKSHSGDGMRILLFCSIVILIFPLLYLFNEGNKAQKIRDDKSKEVHSVNQLYNNEVIKDCEKSKSTGDEVTKIDSPIDAVSKETYSNYQLHNGATPYKDYWGKGEYDKTSLSYIIVKNGSLTDVVVLLYDAESFKVIRNVYVRSLSDYKIKQLPEGIYGMRCYYGNGWNPKLENGDQNPNGGFIRDVSYLAAKFKNDYLKIEFEESREGIDYSTYEVTLHKVEYGNMKTEKISQDKFFK